MRRLALGISVFAMAFGVAASPDPAAGPARPALDQGSSSSRYRFPGGGRILFTTDGSRVQGLGIVDSDGTLRTFTLRRPAFAYWDPAGRDQLLLLPFSDKGATRAVRVQGDRLTRVGSWPTPEGPFTFPSLDGRFLASWVFASDGHVKPGALIVDRSTGRSWTLSSKTLVPRSWTPDGRIVASVWRPHGSVKLWDPLTGATTPFRAGRHLNLSTLSWTPAGDLFAASAGASAIVVGDASGRILRRISLVRGIDGAPTWSPDGTQIALTEPGPGKDGYRHAALHVYDVSKGKDRIIARDLPDPWWASWSPDGRWLLLDAHTHWLFIAADGSSQVRYPSLGSDPRWYGPSSPPISIQVPVC